MSDLIKALQIFLKYGDPRWPSLCEHCMFLLVSYRDKEIISEEDQKDLDKLGFIFIEEYGCWGSTRFGSC
jgi:hypothetical protein